MHLVLRGALELLAPQRCAACDWPVALVDGLFCRPCDVSAEGFDGPGAVFHYAGAVSDAIRCFKYQARSDLGIRLGSRLAADVVDAAPQIDAVVPVPLHWRRRRSRGYDQAALLCRPVGRALERPVLYTALQRVRDTPRQAELPRSERLNNVRGAFRARPRVANLRVLLIDDVKTTGATIRAASNALREAGASEVVPWVLAARVLGVTT